MNSFGVFVVILALIIVGAILLTGVISFARGGEFHKRNANRIMRMRIIAQAIAVLLIILLVTFGRN